MLVLVTRPEPDAIKLVGALQQRGHQAMASPLMSVRYSTLDVAMLEGVTGLIATSRHGLRALVGTDALEVARGLTVFAVGRATALEARRMGFRRVVKGPGTAEALGPLIASMVDPAEEVLLHLAGSRIAYDLGGELSLQGLNVSVETVYAMQPARELSAPVCDAVRHGKIEAVMLMSPQTAAIWSRLVTQHRLGDHVSGIVHLCLSDAVADKLKVLGGVPIEVAEAPNLEEMLALVELAAANFDV